MRKLRQQGIIQLNQLIQRRVAYRLGYHGIDEILDHPWLNLSAQEDSLLMQQKLEPVFIPSARRNQFSKVMNSEENDEERQNALLLKNHEVQQLFEGYNFIRSELCSRN